MLVAVGDHRAAAVPPPPADDVHRGRREGVGACAPPCRCSRRARSSRWRRGTGAGAAPRSATMASRASTGRRRRRCAGRRARAAPGRSGHRRARPRATRPRPDPDGSAGHRPLGRPGPTVVRVLRGVDIGHVAMMPCTLSTTEPYRRPGDPGTAVRLRRARGPSARRLVRPGLVRAGAGSCGAGVAAAVLLPSAAEGRARRPPAGIASFTDVWPRCAPAAAEWYSSRLCDERRSRYTRPSTAAPRGPRPRPRRPRR